MKDKTLKILEYNKIIDMLKEQAGSGDDAKSHF